MTPWLKNHWTVPLFLALVVVVYADPLFRPRAFGGRDLTPYNYPTESVVHDAYARGRLPVWISEISGGRPLLANPNVGALYPVRPLLSRFGPLLSVLAFLWIRQKGARAIPGAGPRA